MLLYVISKNKKDGNEIELTFLDKEIEILLQTINLANLALKNLPQNEFKQEKEFINSLEDMLMEKFVMS